MTTKTLSLIAASLLLSNTIYAEETLKDITVTTANKTAQSLENVTSNVEVITADDIEERGYTSVAEALNALPGISVVSNGGLGTTTSVYIRGMDSKKTLVLIDGVRYNDITGLSGAPFEHLMVSDIERIEVVKGAQSGIWGADAAAGVINIITKEPEKGVHGSSHVEVGSFETKKYGATLSTETENYSLKVSHNVVDTEGFSAQAPKGVDLDTLEDDGYINKTTSVKLGYNIDATNKIKLSYTLIDAKVEYDPFGDPNGFAKSTTKDSFSSIHFNHVDSFNELNLYANRSKFKRKYISNFGTTPFNGEVNEYGITSKIPYRTEDFVLVGIDYKKFEHKNNLNKDFSNKGLFVTNTNTFTGFMGGTTILTESLRYDNYSAFDNELTGKIGLKHIHENIKGLVTSFNYGTAYTVPTLYQLYAPGSTYNNVYYPIGNENLEPETTKSYDITVAYKDFSITYFNNKIDNLIMYTNGYNNITGTSKIDGIEVAYNKEIFNDLLLSMNYTKLFSAEDAQGEKLKRRPTRTLKAAIDYYGIDKLHIGTDLEYVGSRTDKFGASDVETGKYTVVNMSADYQASKYFKVYGKVVNLTNKEYQTVYGYATSPRAFYIGIKARF